MRTQSLSSVEDAHPSKNKNCMCIASKWLQTCQQRKKGEEKGNITNFSCVYSRVNKKPIRSTKTFPAAFKIAYVLAFLFHVLFFRHVVWSARRSCRTVLSKNQTSKNVSFVLIRFQNCTLLLFGGAVTPSVDSCDASFLLPLHWLFFCCCFVVVVGGGGVYSGR
jgi:hypothetical protein